MGRQWVDAAGQKVYKTVALELDVYEKLSLVQRALRRRDGRCTMGEAVDYALDNIDLDRLIYEAYPNRKAS